MTDENRTSPADAEEAPDLSEVSDEAASKIKPGADETD